jgi:hypothetical protein
MSHGAVILTSILPKKRGNTNQTSHIDIIIIFCQKKGQEGELILIDRPQRIQQVNQVEGI